MDDSTQSWEALRERAQTGLEQAVAALAEGRELAPDPALAAEVRAADAALWASLNVGQARATDPAPRLFAGSRGGDA